jgi:hypothetical protein
MDFSSISFIFNRALFLTFSKKKNLIVFCILALSGLLVVFFQGLAIQAGEWVRLSLTFLPIFLCTGILLSTGIFLIRVYHDEVKKKETNYRDIIARSWAVVIGSSYFAVPIILSYLLLWMLLGIFVLLEETPGLGKFFSVVLSFAPFLINLGTLVLCIVSFSMLFFMAPIIALRGIDRHLVFEGVMKRLEKEPFTNMILILTALLPLIGVLVLLTLAAFLTGTICVECYTSLQTVLKWFFIMFPFTAFLTPAVIFFFNFAAESHVLMQKQSY